MVTVRENGYDFDSLVKEMDERILGNIKKMGYLTEYAEKKFDKIWECHRQNVTIYDSKQNQVARLNHKSSWGTSRNADYELDIDCYDQDVFDDIMEYAKVWEGFNGKAGNKTFKSTVNKNFFSDKEFEVN